MIVCFMGNKKISKIKFEDLRLKLLILIEYLILYKDAKLFLFGDNSIFNNLAIEILSNLMRKYTDVKLKFEKSNLDIIKQSDICVFYPAFKSAKLNINSFSIDENMDLKNLYIFAQTLNKDIIEL